MHSNKVKDDLARCRAKRKRSVCVSRLHHYIRQPWFISVIFNSVGPSYTYIIQQYYCWQTYSYYNVKIFLALSNISFWLPIWIHFLRGPQRIKEGRWKYSLFVKRACWRSKAAPFKSSEARRQYYKFKWRN